MFETLCGVYPCRQICGRVFQCQAGMEWVNHKAVRRGGFRVPPPGVNLETGEFAPSASTVYKLHHMGEKSHHVVFTPSPTAQIERPPYRYDRSARVPAGSRPVERMFPTHSGNIEVSQTYTGIQKVLRSGGFWSAMIIIFFVGSVFGIAVQPKYETPAQRYYIEYSDNVVREVSREQWVEHYGLQWLENSGLDGGEK